jgi:hypothetical protein
MLNLRAVLQKVLDFGLDDPELFTEDLLGSEFFYGRLIALALGSTADSTYCRTLNKRSCEIQECVIPTGIFWTSSVFVSKKQLIWITKEVYSLVEKPEIRNRVRRGDFALKYEATANGVPMEFQLPRRRGQQARRIDRSQFVTQKKF